MARQCLFCPSPVNSKEHVFSNWIVKDLKHAEAIKATIGKKLSFYLAKPEIKVGVVCKSCNNTWMSNLETDNKPVIQAMVNDNPCSLTTEEQAVLSRWTVMKAMVVDAINSQRPLFYGSSEREQLRTLSTIPAGTLIWLGRLSAKAFHVGGTDVWGDIDKTPKAFHGCVTNIVMGHLVIQIFTGHAPSQLLPNGKLFVNCRPGKWETNLLDVWPTTADLHWPPPISLTLEGDNNVGKLVNRWKIGTNIGEIGERPK